MSKDKSCFSNLPNEIVYLIFDYLSSIDIIRSFSKINKRYDNIIHNSIKEINLTNQWEGNEDEFKWISPTIKRLIIDHYYIHLIQNQFINSYQNKQNISPPKRKSLIRKIFTCSDKISTKSESSLYEFTQVESVKLLNISEWDKLICQMKLKELTLWYDNGFVPYFNDKILIPKTIIRFCSNGIFNRNCFHSNIISLNISVCSINNLIDIIEQTPNVEELFIHFSNHFTDHCCMNNNDDESISIDKNVNKRINLNKLTRLSIKSKKSNEIKTNERFPFKQLEDFIDTYCSNKRILKKVSMNFNFIIFKEDFWLTILRYKNTFEHFNFYSSFIIEQNQLSNIQSILNPDQFTYHIENGDLFQSQRCYLHIYSKPFHFSKLSGFISTSELPCQCSFNSVRHLHLTETRLGRPISFESLTKLMPNLISLNCNLTYSIDYHQRLPKIVFDENIFTNIRSLRFVLHCWNKDCICRRFLCQLIDRMPHLQSLTTSEINFQEAQRPLPPIKHLDLRECHFQFNQNLVEYFPYLSTLFLNFIITNQRELLVFIRTFFMKIRSLKLISFRLDSESSHDRKRHFEITKQVLNRLQSIDHRLRHLILDHQQRRIDFFLRNL